VHLFADARKPLLLGLLHGLGGGGALVLVVLTTLPSPAAAFLYLLVFGIGSTAGMLVLSGLIGLPFALMAGSAERAGQGAAARRRRGQHRDRRLHAPLRLSDPTVMADAQLLDQLFTRIMRGLVDTGRAPHYASSRGR
jgi:hypothetical protein